MDINYLGHSSFKIKGKTTQLVMDPYDEKITGFKYPSVEAKVLTVSCNLPDHNYKFIVQGGPFIIERPGEYEVDGATILGIRTSHKDKANIENISYVVEIDGLRLLHLGDIGEKLSNEELSEMGEIDILFLPVGGDMTVGPKEASEIVNQIEPKIVIPMHYRTPDINQELFGKLADVNDYLKEVGEASVVAIPKLSITKLDLTEEKKTVVLERKSG